ncbi:(2Fe-2S) ferredoxin domain-containing protein [Streptomyces kaniharaensis]|uniref:(2Fe-2S) ferredoxin domain-containing protein n=1 Tax=Streptomyces kaniharaensis TaxID=212423 RepID=UPI002DDCCF7B|nr:(2Fe-2S) ferredoxin domain-containing protein [Streptomyces kaniharaensis]
MSRRTRKQATGTENSAAARCTVTLCRGCCCGTPKVQGLDHRAQLTDLRESLAGVATVRPTDCLDACEQANVIVVQPSVEGRKADGRPVWLGLVNDPEAARDITARVQAGGPGMADPPDKSSGSHAAQVQRLAVPVDKP